MRSFLVLVGLCCTLAGFVVSTAGAEEPVSYADPPEELGRGPAVFCEGPYALCIKAKCDPVSTRDRMGNYYISQTVCECDVVDGWSMGPGACDRRKPVEKSGRTFLISTYSNLYNEGSKVVQCGHDTVWGWCYGATCVVDRNDPKKAFCSCPVRRSWANILAEENEEQCDESLCNDIYSSATPPADCFANWHYYNWRKENGFEAEPPARKCGTDKPLCDKLTTRVRKLQE